MGITKDTLKVPVVAMGVPTVVDAATMANIHDSLMGQFIRQAQKGASFIRCLKNLTREKYQLICEECLPL